MQYKALAVFDNNTIEVLNSFYVKNILKEMNFKYKAETRSWVRSVNNTYEAKDVLVELKKACLENIDVDEALAKVEAIQKGFSELKIPVRDGLEYKPFQKEFILFADEKRHVILADEMGLGKTIQAIAFINHVQPKSVLVVCPAFLKYNWKDELKKWLTLNKRIKVLEAKDLAVEPFKEEAIYIVNYDILDRNSFQKKFDLVIYDEAHFLKNWKAKRTQNGLKIKGEKYLFLTGTPILNASVELVPIFTKITDEWVFDLGEKDYEKEMKKRFWDFAYKFCFVEKNRFGVKVYGVKDHLKLRELMNPYLIRRLKTQVINELPSKIRKIVKLTPVDSVLVNTEKALFLKENREKSVGGGGVLEEKEKLNLSELTAMSLTEAQRYLKDLIKGKKTEQGLLPLVRHLLGLQKVSVVVDYARNMLENNISHLVIMCWHKSVAHFIAKELEKDAEVFLVVGDITGEERQKLVNKFQEDVTGGRPKIFISTIKAGGLGLTLTKANHMIFAEISYVPADIVQAEDRIHRIGQTLPANIHFLIFKDSLDEMILNVLERKEEDITQVLKQSQYEKYFEKAFTL